LKRRVLVFFTMGLMLFSLALGVSSAEEKPKVQLPKENPISLLTKSMTSRLQNLHVKNIVGDPIKVGKVTIIPIIMVDVGYGGGAGGPNPAQGLGGIGFYLSGQAKPMGFVVISKAGTEFLSVAKVPRK
jgi:uncharacterized spore protein YtfJ